MATAQTASLLADEDFRAGLEARIPLHRIADTDDVVGATLLHVHATPHASSRVRS